RTVHPRREPQRPVRLGHRPEGEPGSTRGCLAPQLHHLAQGKAAAGEERIDGGEAGAQHREELAGGGPGRPDPPPGPVEHCRVCPRCLHLSSSVRPFSMTDGLTSPGISPLLVDAGPVDGHNEASCPPSSRRPCSPPSPLFRGRISRSPPPT